MSVRKSKTILWLAQALCFPVLLLGSGCKKTRSAARVYKALYDPKSYAKQLDTECRQDTASSCTHVGVQHAFGTFGRVKNPAAAIPFLEKGCQGGDGNGCHELGVMFEYGRGVAADPARARAEYAKGCQGHVARSCTRLGDLFSQGRHVTADPAKAKHYYSLACAAGAEPSCDAAK